MRLFLAIALVATPLAAAGQDDALPRHRLVFSRHSDAARTDYDVWSACADGTQLASVVVEPGPQTQAAVTADGERVAYTVRVDSTRDVAVRTFWRDDAEVVVGGPADDTGPAWSPDGARLAFFSTRDADRPELYVLTVATGGVERLTSNALYEEGAAWSPDGRAIYLTRYFPGDAGAPGAGEIVRVDLATGGESVLTDLGGFNGSPAVSPDGGQVVFHRSASGRSDLWRMAADGTGAQPLFETEVLDEYSPAWSPDGRWIAYTAGTHHDGRGTFDVWVVRADGSARRVVASAANTEAWPTWRGGDDTCW